MQITEKQICILPSLPHLDDLLLVEVIRFPSIELSEMLNLTELAMNCDLAKFDITSFCNALRKMPKLGVLGMGCDSNMNERSQFELICQVLIVAVSQNKDVLVSNSHYPCNIEEWKIARKNAESIDMAIQTLNLRVRIKSEENFSEHTKTFVRNHLKSHEVKILKRKF